LLFCIGFSNGIEVWLDFKGSVAQLLISSYDFNHGGMQMVNPFFHDQMFLDQKGSMKQLITSSQAPSNGFTLEI